jgi:hypothetical protein
MNQTKEKSTLPKDWVKIKKQLTKLKEQQLVIQEQSSVIVANIDAILNCDESLITDEAVEKVINEIEKGTYEME